MIQPDHSKVLGRGVSVRGDVHYRRWLSRNIGRSKIARLAHFADAFRQSGFRGGLNWYRNLDRNWDLTAPWQGAQIHQPSLFLAKSRDSVITGLIGSKRVTELEKVLPNLRQKLIIDGAGHWVQQERPDEVNAALIPFLKG